MDPIRVLVVDDSAFMRQTLKAMIEEDASMRVIATARNADDALRKLAKYEPDVVTLDIILSGEKDGLYVLHEMMSRQPTPTIVVSGASDESANYVIEAISSGAFDFIFKPSARPGDIERIQLELQTKIRQAVRSRPAVHSRTMERSGEEPLRSDSGIPSATAGTAAAAGDASLVLIGTSTGGPKALQTVVPALKKNLPAPVLIVQHMPPKFTQSLAERLNGLSQLTVCEAKDGEVLKKGRVYIAPGGIHLQVSQDEGGGLSVHLLDSVPVHGVRPAVDVTLRSLLQIKAYSFVIAILTGMGRDGAEGLEALKKKRKNIYAIAESKESCIVYGMPKAAIETGKVDEVCPLTRVAPAICRQFGIQGAD
ncbi:chemotaxis response regulator protein-glutamate methylesterase [Sporolactobacillus sp. CQH2019]|uniref:protein-glutamate methylesterase/protein-glutamine glutaminase n=1 Tax=Sporolactobacillus sp. CQH2019 TaxID=3023512 RepID=UPI00236799EE|nr:chemotaxis response regulator protein-glutamate methylesterase [Sporolactobacillus sp. CQH2019]MDD9147045.1 chemotaxis response regulator protein-glutamate methylesterase [Sporolactobacillus sp. CQH2019]